MDELEKKRRQLADPSRQLNEIDAEAFEKMSAEEIEAVKASQKFEAQLQQALNIDVPEELADKIILNQRLKSRRGLIINFAMAASIALVSILSFQYFNQPLLPITEEALAHVYDEEDYFERDEVISASEVKARLAKMNLSLPVLPDKITFAYGCRFGGDRAMHIVAEIDGEQVTLFVTKEPISETKLFGDDRLVGQIKNVASHGLIAVAENKTLIDRLYQQIIKV